MNLSAVLSIGILLCISATIQGLEDDVEDEVDPYRLPTTIIPINYELHITLPEDFETNKTFSGSVHITIKFSEDITEVESIILHASNIEILHEDDMPTLTSTDENNPTQIPLRYDLNETTQFIILTPEEGSVIKADTYILSFPSYQGILHTDDMYGFYLSTYKIYDENDGYLATTQFQPTYARRAFPCFDEPSFKATFDVSITRPDGYSTLGNTARKEASAEAPNTDTFDTTPEMSTYLLAFIVSKFENYGKNLENPRYDVWCRSDAIDTAEYAYETGEKLLTALSAYTGIDYYDTGMTKMHQVAIPDFSAGAMENWGLVTYRETALLWDEAKSSASYKQRVATVMAHEFAHMWFGNLVTLDWWSFTWLNEGFARFYQYFITATVEDKWELEKQFVVEQQQVIFGSDAVLSATPLTSDASNTQEISSKFGSISYNKGASVIRMMRNFLGVDVYDSGIKAYLDKHKFDTVEEGDLFDDLASVASEEQLPKEANLADIMETWTQQSGFPVVKVSRNSSGLTFSQQQFLLDSSTTSDAEWYVPITYTTEEESKFNEEPEINKWLIPGEDSFIEAVNQTGWVIANIQATGYYRVDYDEDLWNEIIEALNSDDFGGIPDINRAQIVDDALNLARANKLDYSRAFDITSYLTKEDSYYPWYAAFNAFSFLRRRIGSTSVVGKYLETHILTMMESLDTSPNSTDISALEHVDILKTALAVQWACQLNQEDCVNEATEFFEDFKDGTPVNPNLRSAVYCSALRQAEDDTYWNTLWEKYVETDLATEQITILNALGCSQDEDILKHYLFLSIREGSDIRKQDANTVFSSVLAGNPSNVDIAFSFFKENIDEIVQYYGGMNAVASTINGIADRLTTQEQIDDFAEFINDSFDKLNINTETAEVAIASAKANLKWVESNMEEFETWLTEAYGSAVTITLNLALLSIALIVSFKNFFN